MSTSSGLYIDSMNGNVGIGTITPKYALDVNGTINANTFVGDGSALSNLNFTNYRTFPWVTSSPAPSFTLDSGALTYTVQNGVQRFVDNQVEYNISIVANVTTATTTITEDFYLNLPYPINTSLYTASSNVIGELWTEVITTNSDLFYKTVARIYPTNTNYAIVRLLNGGTEIPFSTIRQGATIRMMGSLEYATTTTALGTALSNININVVSSLTASNLIAQYTMTAPTVSASTIISGNATITGTLIASNLTVLGSNMIVNTYTTETSNFSICNILGTGPALSVYQKGIGAGYPIADFYDVDVSVTVPALRIADGGNVGIGTTLPRQALDVTGDLRVDGTVYGGTGLMFRNRIINGDMRIDQRGSATVAVTTSVYAMDRFAVGFSLTSGAISFGQVALPATLTGFSKCAKLTGTTAVNVSGAGNYLCFFQHIEGVNTADLGFGTSSASSVTLSFWIYSTITNTYSVALRNGGPTRSYVTNFTITNANTWQQVIITIPGDTTGTWATDNTTGLGLVFCFGTGTTFQTTANTWAAGNFIGTSSTATTFGTSSVYITGVQLEKGVVATPFERRPYSVELQLCQRYCVRLTAQLAYSRFGTAIGVSTTQAYALINLPVTMRAAPGNFSYSTLQLAASGSYPITSITAPGTDNSLNCIAVTPFVASGLAAAGAYIITANNSTAAYVQVDAEL